MATAYTLALAWTLWMTCRRIWVKTSAGSAIELSMALTKIFTLMNGSKLLTSGKAMSNTGQPMAVNPGGHKRHDSTELVYFYNTSYVKESGSDFKDLP